MPVIPGTAFKTTLQVQSLQKPRLVQKGPMEDRHKKWNPATTGAGGPNNSEGPSALPWGNPSVLKSILCQTNGLELNDNGPNGIGSWKTSAY